MKEWRTVTQIMYIIYHTEQLFMTNVKLQKSTCSLWRLGEIQRFPFVDVLSKYKGFLSLNELYYPGPWLLPHLFDTFIRFRLGKIALISGIKQVFLQIQIDTEHWDFLRFLWYANIRTNFLPSVLRFTRLVFGLI